MEAYLSSGPPSNMPVGTLGRPTPPDELVLERLLHEKLCPPRIGLQSRLGLSSVCG
ncbi:MAG: hypothetical protein HC893_04100 [Chloroflexaceae bacterium]|nr:hypothetical protein [Chloroflexaceae bacterium]